MWRGVLLAAFCTLILCLAIAAPAQAFKPAGHQVLLEQVRDSLPQGSVIRQAIENNFKTANWGADGPDLGYGYWRVAFGYAPWGDRCHYHLVGSMAAEQLRQALASGDQQKIAWAAGWVTHVCGDMAVHGILVNPEAGVYLDGGNHDLHTDLETWAEPVAWARLGGHSDASWRSVTGWAAQMFTLGPSASAVSLMLASMQTVYGQAPSVDDFYDWLNNFSAGVFVGGGVAYDYVTLAEAEQNLSINGRRAKLDAAFAQARSQSVLLLTAAATNDYSAFTDWWNLDASCTDGRPIGTLTVKIHTANEAFAGTDDDVYFGLSTNIDTQTWLLDKEGYNDFEQNDTDEYYLFTARTNLLPSTIRRIWVEKESDGTGGGWKFGDIDVYINGQLVYSRGVQTWLEDGHLRWQADVQWDYLNSPPTVHPRDVDVSEDTATRIWLSGTDPESDPLTYLKATGPQHGSLSSVSGQYVTYTPERDYVGPDSFTYRAFDGHGYSGAATVTIEVVADPDGDEPNDDPQTATRLTRGVARAGDTDGAGDSDFFYLDLPAWGNPHLLTATLTSPTNTRYLMSIAFVPLGGSESLVWPYWTIDTTQSRVQTIQGNVGPVRIYVLIRNQNPSATSGLDYSLTVDYTSAGSTSPAFTDIGSYRYRDAVIDIAARGIVGGYADGTFRPGNAVLRAQYAKMVALALHLPVWEELTSPFTDLGLDDPGSLYPHEYVAAVATAGITQGTGPTTFSPWNGISLAQLVTMTMRAVDDRLPSVPSSYAPSFSNFDATHYPYARKAAYYNLFAGFTDSYNWFGSATRGQCCLLIHNLLGVLGQ